MSQEQERPGAAHLGERRDVRTGRQDLQHGAQTVAGLLLGSDLLVPPQEPDAQIARGGRIPLHDAARGLEQRVHRGTVRQLAGVKENEGALSRGILRPRARVVLPGPAPIVRIESAREIDEARGAEVGIAFPVQGDQRLAHQGHAVRGVDDAPFHRAVPRLVPGRRRAVGDASHPRVAEVRDPGEVMALLQREPCQVGTLRRRGGPQGVDPSLPEAGLPRAERGVRPAAVGIRKQHPALERAQGAERSRVPASLRLLNRNSRASERQEHLPRRHPAHAQHLRALRNLLEERGVEDPVVSIPGRDHGGSPAGGLEIAHELERALTSSASERREEVGEHQESFHLLLPAAASVARRASRCSSVSAKEPRSRTRARARTRIGPASGSPALSWIAHASASASPTGTR